MNQDKIHQHTVQFQRIINNALKETVFPAMRVSYKEIRAILLDAENLSSVSKVASINREIAKILKAEYGASWELITKELNGIAAYEAEFSANLLQDATTEKVIVPTSTAVEAYAAKELMSLQSGERSKVDVWSAFVNQNIDSNVSTVNNIVKAAYVRGDTVRQASTAVSNAFDGILRRNAETLARTGVQHYANAARKAMYEANLDVIDSWYFSATLDNRTSMVCAGLDGKRWTEQKNVRWPPLHFNCRSAVIALTKGQKYPDGSRAAIGAGENYDKGDSYTGRKDLTSGDFKITQARPTTSYEDFLRRQPKDFQESVLGVGKAKLFREGLPLNKFVDMTGRPLTLAELKKFES